MQNNGTRRNTNRQQNKIKENEFIGKKKHKQRDNRTRIKRMNLSVVERTIWMGKELRG